MEEFYNKHFIRCREDGCIVDGFSDAFREPAETDICINEQGGYQFRLRVNIGFVGEYAEFETVVLSEENPSLFDWDGMIPLYKWDGEVAIWRTEEEIEAERAAIPVPEPQPTAEDLLNIMLGVSRYE